MLRRLLLRQLCTYSKRTLIPISVLLNPIEGEGKTSLSLLYILFHVLKNVNIYLQKISPSPKQGAKEETIRVSFL
jgi:hypothetical protein